MRARRKLIANRNEFRSEGSVLGCCESLPDAGEDAPDTAGEDAGATTLVLGLFVARWGLRQIRENASLVTWLVGIGVFVIGSLSIAFGVRYAFEAGILLFFSTVMHESAHACTSVAFGCPIKAVRCSAIGPHIVRARSESANVELAIASAGPLANLVISVVLMHSGSALLIWTGLANLMMAVINLLPLRNSDGSRVIASLKTMMQASRIAS